MVKDASGELIYEYIKIYFVIYSIRASISRKYSHATSPVESRNREIVLQAESRSRCEIKIAMEGIIMCRGKWYPNPRRIPIAQRVFRGLVFNKTLKQLMH